MIGSPFRYCGAAGYQTSPDSGLILMGYRWYDPQIGRFLTPDPSGSGDNPYAYCGNNPVGSLDPLGLDPGNVNPSPSSGDSQDLSGLLQAGEKWVGKGLRYLGRQLFGSGPGDFQASQFAQNAVSALRYHFGNTSSTFDRYLSAPTYGLPYLSILQGDPYGSFLTQATPIAGQAALALATDGLSAAAEAPSYEWHHLLPQQFDEEFSAIGLDVDDYTIKLERRFHQEYVHGQPRDGKGGSYNTWWQAFFNENENPSQDDVFSYMRALMQSYGINGKIYRYPFAGKYGSQ